MQETLGYLSGAIVVISSFPYIRDILLHKTKPQRATWLIWAVLLTIAFFAQAAKGGTWSLLLTVADTLTVIIIFLLSIKLGVGGTSRFDKLALLGAAIGLTLWYFTNEPLTAILIIILVDFIGGLPTVIKSYKDPYSETLVAYMICSFGALLGVFSVGEMSFSLLVFPVWICLFNFAIGLTILLGRRRARILLNK